MLLEYNLSWFDFLVSMYEILICLCKLDDVCMWVFWIWDYGFVFNCLYVIDIVVWLVINGKLIWIKKKVIGWCLKVILVRVEIWVYFKIDIVIYLLKKYIVFI